MVIVPTQTLASMFKLFAKKSVECVVLNACYSEVQANAISEYVDYVLGMNKAVGDKAALAFSVAFYDALAAGYEVEEAYELGCSQMMSFLENETPVFKKKPLIPPKNSAEIETDITNLDEIIPPNPYQGLSAFGEEDADFFFGQENFVNQLVEVTEKQPLVGVIGPSGSGKSSVVFAGLIPKLRKQGNWLIEIFKPGKEPFLPLAFALERLLEPEAGETQKMREAMGLASDFQQGRITVKQIIEQILERHPGKKLLLVADQLEEVYTLCSVQEEKEKFADELLSLILSKQITLVFTLRADFLNYLLSYRPFRDALQQYTPQFLSSMKREELQQAIELPAQKLEVELEEKLTQRILDDVGEEPGNLPLLEFALTRLWEKQENRTLTHKAYEEIGGVKKAIANHAEQVYQKLSETEKKQAQRIFLQLVRPGEGTEDTRRVATRAEVGEENWNLVSYLASHQARLVVTGRHQIDLTPQPSSLGGNGENEGVSASGEGKQQNQSPSPPRRGVWGEVTLAEDTVEVVHEALIREWLTLRQWMNANRQFRTWQERLKLALREWKNHNDDVGGLLRGTALTVAEDWLQKRADEMTSEERDFIQQSVQQRDSQKQEIERKRRLTIIGLSGFSLMTLGLAGVASFGLWEANIKEINSLSQYSDAVLNLDGSKAVKSSLKALVQDQKSSWVNSANTNTEVQLALLNTVSNVIAPNTLGGHAKSVNAVSFSPDGKILATASDDNTVKLWNTQTGEQIKTLTGHTDKVNSVSFSPNSQILATASNDKTAKLWDISTGQEIQTLTGHKNDVETLSFSPDSTVLATGSADTTIKFWNPNTGKEIKTLKGHNDKIQGLSFSPNGKQLATSSYDSTVKLWDTKTGKEIKTLIEYTTSVNAVSFSPDGKQVVTGNDDKTVKLWDVNTGKDLKTLKGHTKSVHTVSFSPDGKRLVSGSDDNTIKVWDITTGKEIKTLKEHLKRVNQVSFSPDGKQLVSSSNDKTVKFWDITTGKSIKTLISHTEKINQVSFSPDGKRLATASDDNTVKLWDTLTQKEITTLVGHTDDVYGVSFSPDGKQVATGSGDKTAKLWDTTTGQEIRTLKGHQGIIYALSFSPDGQWLTTGSNDKTVKVWEVATGKEIKTLKNHTDTIYSMSFSPNGKWLATGSYDNTVKLWDTTTWKEIKTLTSHTNTVFAVNFSGDSKLLASGSADYDVKLWDTSTWQEIKTLTGHTDTVHAVSFNPDGTQLVTSSADNTVKLWDTATGEELKTLSGHTDTVYAVSFNQDGNLIATGSADNTVRLWRLDTGYLVEEGCYFINNYLKPNPKDNEALDIEQELCSKQPESATSNSQ